MSIKLLMRKMNNFLSRGKLLDFDNTSKVPLLKVGLMANEIYDGLEFPQQFGIKSYPPKNCEVITAHFGGNRNHGTVLNAFDRNLMPDDLEEGETCLYNAFNARITLDKDSNIKLENENITITITAAGALTIGGNVSITGNLVVSGTINGIHIP